MCRRPVNALAARVFSDPRMDCLRVRVSGDRLHFGDGQSAPASDAFAGLAEGNYLAGFRPNHLEMAKKGPSALEFATKLQVTEITGSKRLFIWITKVTVGWA